MRGRTANMTATEMTLIEDAALTLAIAGGNKQLCEELSQKTTPPTIRLEELPAHGLPNPALALMCPDQLNENLELVDKCFPRGPTSRTRRLICAVDATYLLRSICQFSRQGKAGLVGAPWNPEDESLAFMDIGKSSRGIERASVMMEFLVWNPCGVKKESFSIASMPMSLQAPRQDPKQTLTHAGNWEACPFMSVLTDFL